MEKAIKVFGYITNGLLLVALAMFYLKVPNYALLIVLGLLLMMFAASPAFLIYLNRNNATLGDNTITNGISGNSVVDSILTYDGSGFLIPENAVSILSFDSNFFQWEPQRVWDYQSVEPYSLIGYSQGAYKEFGNGRVAVYGDAMMFTAQLGAGLSWVRLGCKRGDTIEHHGVF